MTKHKSDYAKLLHKKRPLEDSVFDQKWENYRNQYFNSDGSYNQDIDQVNILASMQLDCAINRNKFYQQYDRLKNDYDYEIPDADRNLPDIENMKRFFGDIIPPQDFTVLYFNRYDRDLRHGIKVTELFEDANSIIRQACAVKSKRKNSSSASANKKKQVVRTSDEVHSDMEITEQENTVAVAASYISPSKLPPEGATCPVNTNSRKEPSKDQGTLEASEEQNADQVQTQVRGPKPKPIMVDIAQDLVANIPDFTCKLEAECTEEFTVKSLPRHLKIFPDNVDAKQKIIEFLKKRGTWFYVTPDMKPPLKAVIRGLHISTDVELVKDFLTGKGYQIEKIFRKKSRKDGRTLPLIEVHLVKCKDSRDIFHIREIFKFRVTVDKFRPPGKAQQCYKCQGFFHKAADCHRQEKCVACGDNHRVSECPRKQIEKVEDRPPAKCANCGLDHPASYKGCKRFPNLQKKSYAEAIKPKEKTPAPVPEKNFTQPKPIDEVQEIQTEVSDFLKVIQEIKQEIGVGSFSAITEKLHTALDQIKARPEQDSSQKLALLVLALADIF